jgi:hypothetical protein
MRLFNLTVHGSTHHLLQIVIARGNTCKRIGWHIVFDKKMFHAGDVYVFENAREINDAFANRHRTCFRFVKILYMP